MQSLIRYLVCKLNNICDFRGGDIFIFPFSMLSFNFNCIFVHFLERQFNEFPVENHVWKMAILIVYVYYARTWGLDFEIEKSPL